MQNPSQDDERMMSLVEAALARPIDDRESYLRDACGRDAALFGRVWQYIQWEERMQSFLRDPVIPPVAESPFEAGELLEGRFRILREIARGGMGVVYEAVDEKLDRRVALKCARAGFDNRLPPEVRNATAVSHPNVCKIYEIHTASTPRGDIDFLTMEFLEGETLADRIARGLIPEREARDIAAQLCAGLEEAHRNLVIHGDLKSNNVILARSPGGDVKAVITDFGLARRPGASERGIQSGLAGGAPDYMAPELWTGSKATVASDIYALGVVLHELICGRRPVAGSWVEIEHPRWRRVIARCLDPEPARRLESAARVAQALAPISRRWFWGAAVTVALATVSGVVSYQHATAPRESITLAMAPLKAEGVAAGLGSTVSADVAAHIQRLRGDHRVSLAVISLERAVQANVTTVAAARKAFDASFVVGGTLRREQAELVLHAILTDARTQAVAADREFRFAAREIHYAGEAAAGMVTAALRIPPLQTTGVNPAAQQDYVAGVAFTRRNSTLDRAVPLLERAVRADPDSPLTWAGLAEAQWFQYYVSQDPAWLERAAESVRQAQNRNLDVAAVHQIAGLLRANESAYEQAIAEYSRAVELEPSRVDAHRRLGQVYESANQLPLALAAYQKAAGLEPGYFKVYQDLGTYYSHRGDYAEAIAQFQKCVQAAPDEPDAHYVLGTALLHAGRYAEAEAELRAAIRLGDSPRAWNNLAAALTRQDKDREAIPVLVRALDRFPTRYLWWMNLGDAYRRTNLPAEAARAYRRSLDFADREMARDPRDGDTRARVAYICARLGQRQRAESEIAQALRLAPESVTAFHLAVWTYEALGRREQSLAILKISPDRVLPDVLRSGDLAELRKDSRFQQWVETRQAKQESPK